MRFKRTLAITSLCFLSFSNAAIGAMPSPQSPNSPLQPYKQDQKVRVIVELEGTPGILYAQKLGKQFDELPRTEQSRVQGEALSQQADVKTEVAQKGIKMHYENSFTTVMNGFSGEVQYSDIAKLESLPNVSDVHIVHEYERPIEKPEMITSKELVQASKTWAETGYKGEGMVVGVIDTGIDSTHRDMILSPTTKFALTQDRVNAKISENHLNGKFFTNKVPYGYNYMDHNTQILDLGPDATMHGMHVSGTVAANGDENNGGIKGVAPEAQLLALKVFGNDPEFPSTFSDVYVKAIDDAIALGADVLNMSLGSTAAFVDPSDPEEVSIKRAVDNGILMSISAGNSAQFGSGAGNPYASNPDIGVVGSPGLTHDSLQVASLENSHINLDGMKVSFDGVDYPTTVGWKQQSTPNPLDVFGNKKMEVVYVGDGSEANYTGKDVAGKIVFAVRSNAKPLYVDIQKMAESKGAAGVIVRGRVVHGDYVSMALDHPQIPMVTLSLADGNALEAKAQTATKMEVVFDGSKTIVPNSAAGQMSSFTSWGVTPNLDFKPEITAPGGQIYSTFNNNTYGLMSGTSMAAPHVSGGSALVLERVKKDFPNLTGLEKVQMAKNLLMDTAAPVLDTAVDLPYSPRRQGAGLMQIHSAVTTPVIVTDEKTGESKEALKEISGNTVTFSLIAKNYSDSLTSYKVNANVLTDYEYKGKNLLHEQELQNAPIKINGEATPTIDVKAKSSTKLTVTIDLTNATTQDGKPLAEVFPNGTFIEGFVTLTDALDDSINQPKLTVPYVGFKGDWNKPPILDPMVYDEETAFYGAAGMLDTKNPDGDYLGQNALDGSFDSSKIAISPNGDGVKDSVTPVLSFLRNAKLVEYNVLDANKKVIRKIRTENNVRKNYYDSGRNPYYYFNTANAWDGLANNEKVQDGKYYYEIKSTIDFEGKAPQTKDVPVIVDTKVPTVTTQYNKDTGKLTIQANDNAGGSGLSHLLIYVDDKLVQAKPFAPTTTEYVFGEKVSIGSQIKVEALDNAGNTGTATIEGAGDVTIPYITAEEPTPYGSYATKEIPVSGYITDQSKIADFTVDGKAVPVTWNDTTKRYEFKTTVKVDSDGVYKIPFSGTDAAGNKIDFLRTVFVDTTAPTVDVNQDLPEYVAFDAPNPTATVKVADNFSELRFLINGNEEFYNEFKEPFEMKSFEKTVSKLLELHTGNNTFEFKATDLSGNETVKQVNIYKLAKGETPPATAISDLQVNPNTNVSTSRPAHITAQATDVMSWNVKVIDPSGVATTLPSYSGKTYDGTFVPTEFSQNGEYTVQATGTNLAGKTVLVKETKFTVYNFSTAITKVEVLDAHGHAASSFGRTGVTKIKASVGNLGTDVVNPLVIIQVLDQQKRVVHKAFLTVDSLTNGSATGLGTELSLSGLAAGTYSVEVYVWSDWDSQMPLSEAQKGKVTFKVE